MSTTHTGWETARDSWLEGTKRAKGAWAGFKQFLFRDSVLEVAVGLIIAQGFTRIVSSFTSDILLPFVALLPIFDRNLPQKFLVLRAGPNGKDGYNTITQAEADGAITMTYGRFIDNVINFLALGVVLYLIARAYAWSKPDSQVKASAKCQYCRKDIAEKALRCAFCCSWLDGREDRETSALAHPPPPAGSGHA